MDRGTYSAASGGLVQLRRLDIINNNLANVNTPGFKRQLLVTETQKFDDTLASTVAKGDPFAPGDHERTPGVANIQAVTDFSVGPMKNTGNPLDVALRKANHFFVVSGPEGTLYTRAGNFTLNSEGTLVTQDGWEVQGDGGPITATGGSVSISPDGSVRVNGQGVGRIQVVEIPDTSNLERVEGTRFRMKQPGAPEAVPADLEPAALEMANVSAITSVLDLISTHRAFDLYTKSANTIDQMNQISISQVGRRM